MRSRNEETSLLEKHDNTAQRKMRSSTMILRHLLPLLLFVFVSGILLAAKPIAESSNEDPEAVPAGHSYHGESFSEGPRQAAVLIPGMAKIDFPTSTKSVKAQQFFEQGVAALHGFWYLEAERSFRQTAKEDPEMAMAYWGMALANKNNTQRARDFIDEAMKRCGEGTSDREELYIKSLNRFLSKPDNDPEKKQSKSEKKEAKRKRGERYLSDLEKILHEYPDDIEAKAQIVVQMWLLENEGIKITSRYAANALLNEIFAANPTHPAHHYCIHLWDSAHAENSLKSSALCGPSSPGIAHMWHMPGHIYSKLNRYRDAVWQQEASARVDHAHMIRTRLIPDQIHNFAHNNEWLVRNLIHVGRVQDAIGLSMNLMSLPRHPNYNSLSDHGSHLYGRERLFQTLSQFELWDQLMDQCNGPILVPTDNEEQQEERLGWLAVAHFKTDNAEEARRLHRLLRRRHVALQTQQLDLEEAEAACKPEYDHVSTEDDGDDDGIDKDDENDKNDSPTRKELRDHMGKLRKVIARVSAASAVERKNVKLLHKQMDAAKLDEVTQARWLADAGDVDAAIKKAKEAVEDGENEVRPLALLVDLLWASGEEDKAKERFADLRKIASVGDLDTPLLAKLAPVAEAMEIEGDWRIAQEPATDLGKRPCLDELGPFQWQPYSAPSWQAQAPNGEQVCSEDYQGKPTLLIFYLGFGCLHCMEQLHEFAPRTQDFSDAGIRVVAISSETLKELQTGIKGFDKKLEIPLLSSVDQQAFHTYRCWDDFEDQPLHGTFLIDSQGRVRWQDIGYQPFMDSDFLLKESQRLLSLP